MPTARADLRQLNVHLPTDMVELVDSLQAEYGWNKRDLVMTALRALDAIMDAHGKYAAQHPPDVAELYMRLAREAPAAFVEVPKDGV
jgi:hypothetical protein